MADIGSIGSGAAAGSTLGPWGALAGAGLGAIGGFLMRSRADELRRAQALEDVRRQGVRDSATLGQATAAGAASGVDYESPSLQTYLASMSNELHRERAFSRNMAQEGADASGTGNLLQLGGDIGSGLFRFAASNNWWR